MSLKEFLQNHMSAIEFAAAVGCSRECVYLWLHGKTMPHPYHIRVIERVTNGFVKVEDLFATKLDFENKEMVTLSCPKKKSSQKKRKRVSSLW